MLRLSQYHKTILTRRSGICWNAKVKIRALDGYALFLRIAHHTKTLPDYLRPIR